MSDKDFFEHPVYQGDAPLPPPPPGVRSTSRGAAHTRTVSAPVAPTGYSGQFVVKPAGENLRDTIGKNVVGGVFELPVRAVDAGARLLNAIPIVNQITGPVTKPVAVQTGTMLRKFDEDQSGSLVGAVSHAVGGAPASLATGGISDLANFGLSIFPGTPQLPPGARAIPYTNAQGGKELRFIDKHGKPLLLKKSKNGHEVHFVDSHGKPLKLRKKNHHAKKNGVHTEGKVVHKAKPHTKLAKPHRKSPTKAATIKKRLSPAPT